MENPFFIDFGKYDNIDNGVILLTLTEVKLLTQPIKISIRNLITWVIN